MEKISMEKVAARYLITGDIPTEIKLHRAITQVRKSITAGKIKMNKFKKHPRQYSHIMSILTNEQSKLHMLERRYQILSDRKLPRGVLRRGM